MKDKSIKIIFFGSDENSSTLLELLIKNKYNIQLVITKTEKQNGRKININLVKNIAIQNNIKILEADKLSDKEFEIIKNINPKIGILLSYGAIIPENIIKIFPFGILNIHPSLLPKYRGSSPVQYTLLNGDEYTGVSVMLLTKKMDAGPIIAQEKMKIENNDNYSSLSKKLFDAGNKLLIENVEKYINGEIKTRNQDEKNVTLTKIIKKEDGLINWNNSSGNINNKIRAFENWPSAYTRFNEKILKIIEAESVNKNSNNKIGQVFQENNDIFIQCKSEILKLKKIQLEGKSSCDIKSFVNGYKNFVGSILKSFPEK
ncbi:MAG: methionyl-tRNA formyltransferase [Patescibacteria group bacterium]|nr:methionyl-tRNA formyltransferase [Patescibacteria group bacterium]MDD4304573.1 methionyl-tRNA formyltransferase [Patescibacteria group bacterium]MDD4695608.1 methionyl-tRNA formyltransferase [Patescibacteria group bacterium]